MSAPTSTWIHISEAEIGQQYLGYKTSTEPNCKHCCSITYIGNGSGLVFDKQAENNIEYLLRYTTFKEQEAYYKKHFDINDRKCQFNLIGLYHDMYNIGDACHQMWNAWVSNNFYEMNERLLEEELCLIGIAPAPYACAVFENSCAFVIENTDCERFWCHANAEWAVEMRDQMQDVYSEYTKPTI